MRQTGGMYALPGRTRPSHALQQTLQRGNQGTVEAVDLGRGEQMLRQLLRELGIDRLCDPHESDHDAGARGNMTSASPLVDWCERGIPWKACEQTPGGAHEKLWLSRKGSGDCRIQQAAAGGKRVPGVSHNDCL